VTDSSKHLSLITLSHILPVYISNGLRPERDNGVASASRNVPPPNGSAESDILFTPEAAALLRATTQQTSELARKGLIPAFKIGKRWRFSRKTLCEWVEKASTQHLDLFSPSATPPSPPEPVKVKPKKRRNFPTDLSPEGLREALKAGNKTGNESASKKQARKIT
jgi:excisionase family DNA binding protein